MTTAVFEEKNIQKAILTLGLPAMLGQLATLIYNLVDTYFVSLTNSPAQIAAVTLSTPILLIIMSVSSVCGMGGSSVIARLLGEKRTETARSSLTFCVWARRSPGSLSLLPGCCLFHPSLTSPGQMRTISVIPVITCDGSFSARRSSFSRTGSSTFSVLPA